MCLLLRGFRDWSNACANHCRNQGAGAQACGAAWAEAKTLIVEDVEKFPGHIACSSASKSEIVVPLFVNGVNIGQIDIDSHVIDPFTEADERFLEFVNQEVAKLF